MVYHMSFTIVRPIMEYAAVIWDPFHLNKNWRKYNTGQPYMISTGTVPVTAMIEHLSWTSQLHV